MKGLRSLRSLSFLSTQTQTYMLLDMHRVGTSLEVQWLKLHTSNAGGSGLILVRELKSYMPAGKKSKHKAEAIL